MGSSKDPVKALYCQRNKYKPIITTQMAQNRNTAGMRTELNSTSSHIMPFMSEITQQSNNPIDTIQINFLKLVFYLL